MIKKVIDIPIYRGKLTIIFDKDLSYVEKKFKTPELKNYGAVTLRHPSEFRHYIVAFEDEDYSLVAHEVVHIVNYLFVDVGVELDRINDEAQAYLTGWLFGEIEKVMNKVVW